MRYTRSSVWKNVNKYFRINKTNMIYNGFLVLLITSTSIITPYLYKVLVDEVMTNKKWNELFVIIPAMMVVYLIQVFFSALNTYLSNRFLCLTNLEIKEQMMKQFLDRDVSKARETDIGIQVSNLEKDTAAVHTFLSRHIVGYITSIIISLVYFLLMVNINIWLTVISMSYLPVTYLLSKILGGKMNEINRRKFEVTSYTNTYLYDSLQKWKEIKVNSVERRFVDGYNEKLKPEKELNSIWMKYFAWQDVMYLLKDMFFLRILIYFVGGLFIIAKEISIGELLMFMSYLKAMSRSLDKVMKSNSDFISQKAVFERLFSFIKEKEKPYSKQECPEKPTISMINAGFSYKETGDVIFEGVNCEFAFGKKYLIEGNSGEGKTTLIKLLLGINDIEQGEILINNKPYSHIDSKSRLRSIGVVMQENCFFNLSIRENLKLIAPNASSEEMERALELACLDEFIDSLPQRLDTVIGERGVKLSGGQKQRLAIARVILYAPQIVILDEATSALDSISEGKVIANLCKIFEGKTFIVVSHKLLKNYYCDYRIRINNKNIVLD